MAVRVPIIIIVVIISAYKSDLNLQVGGTMYVSRSERERKRNIFFKLHFSTRKFVGRFRFQWFLQNGSKYRRARVRPHTHTRHRCKFHVGPESLHINRVSCGIFLYSDPYFYCTTQ